VTWGAVVAGLWYFHVLSGGWLLGLGLFFGVIPVLTGTRRLVRDAVESGRGRREALEDKKTRDADRRDSLEKTVLQIAKERQGVVTPALVVLRSDLKLEEAEKVLGSLAARGYAEMRIKDNGTIDYVFHDLT
jgi:ribosomal protein S25